MSRFCPRCGAELSPEDRFCSACGAAVPGAVFSNKAVGQEPLTGTAFVEKSKEWARPQKGGMHPGFIVLLVLLLLVFLGVAALLGIHLFGRIPRAPVRKIRWQRKKVWRPLLQAALLIHRREL